MTTISPFHIDDNRNILAMPGKGPDGRAEMRRLQVPYQDDLKNYTGYLCPKTQHKFSDS
jgi:hypothetical protein